MKILLKCMALVISIITLVIIILFQLYKFHEGTISFALINAIAEYADAHHGSYPNNWSDFCLWSNRENGNDRWKVDELNARFVLPWGKNSAQMDEDDVFITVIDPRLKYLEMNLNKNLNSMLYIHRLRVIQP